MEGQESPLRHFQLMVQVADHLRALPAQILEHHYQYDAFGSWWTTLKRRGQLFRVVFDGKERELRLERATGGRRTEWRPVFSRLAGDTDAGQALRDIINELRATE
jgi:hypothetical protein